jgi:hypothetical protein
MISKFPADPSLDDYTLLRAMRRTELELESTRLRISRTTKRLAARLAALLAALFLAVAVLNLVCQLNSPVRALVFLAVLACGAWGKHYLSTRH